MKSITILFSLLLTANLFSQDASLLFNKATESFESSNYQDALLYLSKAEKIKGANPRIETLRIFCYDALGDLKNTKISLLRYFDLVPSEYKSTQAHKDILEIDKRVDALIAAEDKKVTGRIQQQRNDDANKIINQKETQENKKKNETIALNKKSIESILKQNASSDLNSQLGKEAKELEKLGISISDFKEARLTFADGIYTGELRNGKQHGDGTMKYNNGDIYMGSWSEGVKSGAGEMIFANKDKFIGDWYNDFFREGKLTKTNQDIYSGTFNENGKLIRGEFIQSNGYYQKGEFDEKGVFKTGNLKTTLSQGTVYEGEYVNYEYTGKAEIKYADGTSYTGDVLSGKKHGIGVFKTERYEITGNWRDDKRDGARKHYYIDKIFTQQEGRTYFGLSYVGFPLNREWRTHQAFINYSYYSKYFFNLGFGIGTFTAPKYYTYYSFYDPYQTNEFHTNQSIKEEGGFTGFNGEANAGIHVELFNHLILKCNYSVNAVASLKSIDYNVYKDYYTTSKSSYIMDGFLWSHSLRPEIMLRFNEFTIGVFYSRSIIMDPEVDSVGNKDPYTPFEAITFNNLTSTRHLFGIRVGIMF